MLTSRDGRFYCACHLSINWSFSTIIISQIYLLNVNCEPITKAKKVQQLLIVNARRSMTLKK